MTSRLKKLTVIKDVTEIKSEISRARLAEHRMLIEGIEARILAVDAAQADTAPSSISEGLSIARYAAWAEQQKTTLRDEMAMAMARAQPVKEQAARDEARAQVVKRLIKSSRKPAGS